jgi:putative SOS response-associated peptidase YedK
MCGRYYIEIDEQELGEIVADAEKSAAGRGAQPFRGGEIFPGVIAPVLAGTGAGFMAWGFPGVAGGRPLINARSETAAATRTFRDAWRERRCLVPASGYFEWKPIDSRRKEKYAFTLPSRETLYMAGIYSPSGRFAILTREAAPALAAIHSRMPVIIPKSLAGVWLRESPEVAREAILGLRFAAVPSAGTARAEGAEGSACRAGRAGAAQMSFFA